MGDATSLDSFKDKPDHLNCKIHVLIISQHSYHYYWYAQISPVLPEITFTPNLHYHSTTPVNFRNWLEKSNVRPGVTFSAAFVLFT